MAPRNVSALSAGLLAHRCRDDGGLEVLIVHPGGPFWANRDDGAWSVPKGEYTPDEDARSAAGREFVEELGVPIPTGTERFLGVRRQPSGKMLSVWAIESDVDLRDTRSNEVTIEWPRGSGRVITFPEVDRAEWCSLEDARRRLLRGHVPFLDDLVERLGAGRDPDAGAVEGGSQVR